MAVHAALGNDEVLAEFRPLFLDGQVVERLNLDRLRPGRFQDRCRDLERVEPLTLEHRGVDGFVRFSASELLKAQRDGFQGVAGFDR